MKEPGVERTRGVEAVDVDVAAAANHHAHFAFWPALWLALVLAGAKAVHWAVPELTWRRVREYATDVAVSSHLDLALAAFLGLAAYAALRLTARWRRAHAGVRALYLVACFVCAVFAVASVQIFAFLRSPLTYALLYLAGDMANMRSSIGAFLTLPLTAALVLVPAAWTLATRASLTRAANGGALRLGGRGTIVGAGLLGAYLAGAHLVYQGRWRDREDHLIARSPHWELAASFATESFGLSRAERFAESYTPDLLDDFRPAPARAPGTSTLPSGPRPRNVILYVLESTGSKYLTVHGSPYPTTPNLMAAARDALVYDAFHTHVGQTANSVAAIVLSIYPYMTWREYTVEYPDLPGESLAEVVKARGFRTAFIQSGDFEYANQRAFVSKRGFDTVRDWRDLGVPLVSSWGSTDAAVVDDVLAWIDADRERPFLALAWTQQSHHPYEPVPGVPVIDFFEGRERPEDDYDLGRYLNTIHYADAQIGRLLDGLRERGLADETVVVVTGDHPDAFGDPHPTWGHGSRIYQENVGVPLVIWSPRLFPGGGRPATVGGHVDLNPTLADLLGIEASPTWRGRSLFEAERPPRAYFYAANDDYLLGLREGTSKYIYNATRGKEELYDLAADPLEKTNIASERPDVCRRFRQRLAAWRDETGRHLAEIRARRAASAVAAAR